MKIMMIQTLAPTAQLTMMPTSASEPPASVPHTHTHTEKVEIFGQMFRVGISRVELVGFVRLGFELVQL